MTKHFLSSKRARMSCRWWSIWKNAASIGTWTPSGSRKPPCRVTSGTNLSSSSWVSWAKIAVLSFCKPRPTNTNDSPFYLISNHQYAFYLFQNIDHSGTANYSQFGRKTVVVTTDVPWTTSTVKDSLCRLSDLTCSYTGVGV